MKRNRTTRVAGVWHVAFATTLVIAASACGPDVSVAPAARDLGSTANAARVTGIVQTDIIPATFPSGGQAWGRAWAINEAGVVAGHRFVIASATIPSESNLFLWKDGEFTLYPNNIVPIAINRRLEIAGNSSFGVSPFGDVGGQIGTNRALYWKDGVVTDLGTLGGSGSIATDINEKGDIVGYSRLAGGTDARAFLWSDGVMIDLGTLGGATATAYGINNHGQVVGTSTTASGETHGFLWEKGTMTDLGVLQGNFSGAFAINDRGQIAGLARAVTPNCGPGLVTVPVIWDRGQISALPVTGVSLCVSIIRVRDISDAGHVLGTFSFTATKPWVWRDGVTVVLPIAGDAGAFKINSSGETAGFASESVRHGAVSFWSVGRHGP